MNRIIVTPQLCTGCMTCYRACFVDVIRWNAEKRFPIIAYPAECVQCNYCQLLCKYGAIRVVPDYPNFMFPRDVLESITQEGSL